MTTDADGRIRRIITECVVAGIPVTLDGKVQRHQHVPDPQSGAGNCVCGRHGGHVMHQARR